MTDDAERLRRAQMNSKWAAARRKAKTAGPPSARAVFLEHKHPRTRKQVADRNDTWRVRPPPCRESVNTLFARETEAMLPIGVQVPELGVKSRTVTNGMLIVDHPFPACSEQLIAVVPRASVGAGVTVHGALLSCLDRALS
jgi:hypothetical protein